MMGLSAVLAPLAEARRQAEVDEAVRAWMFAPGEERSVAASQMLECDANGRAGPARCMTCGLWRLNIVDHWHRQRAHHSRDARGRFTSPTRQAIERRLNA